jgi:hypothetical protein
MNLRPICTICNKNHCAVNYHKNEKTYYRKTCDGCGRISKKLKARKPTWTKSGYKKKSKCDLCGFNSLFTSQITVFHVDGNLENTNHTNLRSVCLNCIEVIKRKEVNWKRGDLVVDQ